MHPAATAEGTPLAGALCTACALCCNGVLFADVRLQSGDDAAQLAILGVSLKRRGETTRFQQPCSCLHGNSCTIYAERPSRCRTFECRLLQRALNDEISGQAALQQIQQARREADNVRRILHELGDMDETVPLSRRYQRMMRRPIDLSGDDRLVDLRGELMMSVARLMERLKRDFLTPRDD
ncbi:MAG TPA: YkgJ family cysteine cluster protein [Methylomirabilota bacterium]|nr:YkgJ family cysteine cluster protein [Methylomirabilota bacterium]